MLVAIHLQTFRSLSKSFFRPKNETYLILPHLSYFKILSVLNIVIKVAPTSAKTACHISATPNKLKTNVNILTPIEKIKFCLIILFFYFANFFFLVLLVLHLLYPLYTAFLQFFLILLLY